MVMYPNVESMMMSIAEYEASTIQVFMEMYYQIYPDFEEIQND